MNLDEFKGKFTPFKIKINKNPDNHVTVEIVDCPIKGYKITDLDISKGSFMKRIQFSLYNSDGEELAFVLLDLNLKDEITKQDIVYYGSDNLIMRHSSQQICTDSTIVHESFNFTKMVDGIKENLEILQIKGNVILVTYNQYQKGIFSSMFQSSLFNQPETVTDYLYFPYRGAYVSNLSLYPAVEAKLKEILHLDINCSKEELENKMKEILDYNKSIGNIIKIIPDYESNVFTDYTFENHLDLVFSYIDNRKHNDLLQYFKGNYIGCIYSIDAYLNTSNQSNPSLIVVTEKEKNGNVYRCYTIIESGGIDKKDIIRAAENGPKYVTIFGKDGKEELHLYNGDPVSTLDPEEITRVKTDYDEFFKIITRFSDIQPVKIEDFTKKGIDR